MQLIGKFVTSNFLHSVSLPAAFAPRCNNSSENRDMFLSLSHSLLSPRHISSSFSFSCISPSPPFFPQQRSRPHFFHSCILRSAPTHSPHSSIPPGTDTVSCHPIKALIYCISQIGDFSYLHIASFCLFLSLIFLLHPPVLAQSLSAGVKKYPGSRQSWHQGERCVDP